MSDEMQAGADGAPLKKRRETKPPQEEFERVCKAAGPCLGFDAMRVPRDMAGSGTLLYGVREGQAPELLELPSWFTRREVYAVLWAVEWVYARARARRAPSETAEGGA